MGEITNAETNRKYCVRIRDGEHGRKWYSGKRGDVFVVKVSENPNAGYLVESGDVSIRTIDKDHAELIGPVGDFEREGSEEETVSIYGKFDQSDRHITALAQSIAELRRELDAVTANVQTFAETATSADYKAGQALTTSAQFADRLDAHGGIYDILADDIECLTDDVVMLDARTQPLTREGISELSTELAEVVTKTITERMRLNGE